MHFSFWAVIIVCYPSNNKTSRAETFSLEMKWYINFLIKCQSLQMKIKQTSIITAYTGVGFLSSRFNEQVITGHTYTPFRNERWERITSSILIPGTEQAPYSNLTRGSPQTQEVAGSIVQVVLDGQKEKPGTGAFGSGSTALYIPVYYHPKNLNVEDRY